MRELSIFIDESGDFGAYAPHSPYYIISLVFHDQDEDIQPAIDKLELCQKNTSSFRWPIFYVHWSSQI